MEMYGIRESSLPCLLFTDGKEFRRSLVVTLDAQDPISSLYSDCLRPLSDQFGLLSKHWSLCAELARKRSFIKYAHDVIDRTPRELAAIPAKIEEETRQFEARVLPLKTRLAELHHNVSDLDKSADTSSADGSLATKLQAELDAISAGERTFRSPGHQALEVAKLTKRMQKVRHDLRSQSKDRRRELTSQIEDVSRRIEHERWPLIRLEQEMESGKRQLESQRKVIEEYTPAIPIEEEAIRDSEAALKVRGYRIKTLRSDPPSAFDAIEDMSKQGLLGSRKHSHATRGDTAGCDPKMGLRCISLRLLICGYVRHLLVVRIAQNAVDFSVFKGVGSQILGDRRLA